MTDPTGRFSGRVADYIHGRPSYPVALVDRLVDLLRPGAAVVDIGAGTGVLTGLLLDRGVSVFAVEPNREMRAAGEDYLAARSGWQMLDGTGEATGLGSASVDLVTVAQAFHWLDRDRARAEFNRILRPAGQVALIWNDRRDGANAMMSGYEQLLQSHATDYRVVDHRRVDESVMEAWFGGSMTQASFEYRHRLDRAGLIARVGSCSYVPQRGAAGFDSMQADVNRLFDDHADAGQVEFIYDTRLYHGRPG